MVSWFQRYYFLRNIMVEQDDAYPHCPVTPDFLKGGETLERQYFEE
jgi:hypothetical protein